MQNLQTSARARIHYPASCRHNRKGFVVGYKAESNSYFVDFDGKSLQFAKEYMADVKFCWGKK